MSGGRFDYAYSRVSNFADDLEEYLARQGKPTGWDDEVYYTHTPEAQAEFERIMAEARQLSRLMRAAEWRASGETDDEEFLQEVTEARKEAR